MRRSCGHSPTEWSAVEDSFPDQTAGTGADTEVVWFRPKEVSGMMLVKVPDCIKSSSYVIHGKSECFVTRQPVYMEDDSIIHMEDVKIK